MRLYRQLQLEERIVIKKMYYKEKISLREIARKIGRHPSTISREIKRNATHGYHAYEAHQKAETRRKQATKTKWEKHPPLALEVEAMLLEKRYSPEIIAATLKKNYPDNATMQLSHETIYKHVYKSYHTKKRKDLVEALFFRRRRRQKRANKNRSRIIDYTKKNIRERPVAALERKEVGHLEGDLIESAKKDAYVLTLVDRCSSYSWALRMPSKDADTVMRGIIEVVSEMPQGLIKTMTFDNGKEFSYHKIIEEAVGCNIYFADPYAAWQRGINENVNRMYRYFLPKKKSFAHLTDDDIDAITEMINKRPRKSKGWKSSYEVLQEHLSVALQT